jgi:hypothetical protein
VTHDVEPLTITAQPAGNSVLLTVAGRLDSTTYRRLRNSIVKAALDEPRAVLIDVSGLRAPSESAWSALTSARWLINRWPDVPVVLVCDHAPNRSALRRNGITRYLPLFVTVADALAALSLTAPPRFRRHASADLGAVPDSAGRARELVEQWLTMWDQCELIAATKVVATEFVENVLAHTTHAPSVWLETDGKCVTVAVSDASHAEAAIREPDGSRRPAGLEIVATLARAWGIAPTPSGKTVWAVIGPENQL